jgi:hypothetical protein
MDTIQSLFVRHVPIVEAWNIVSEPTDTCLRTDVQTWRRSRNDDTTLREEVQEGAEGQPNRKGDTDRVFLLLVAVCFQPEDCQLDKT